LNSEFLRREWGAVSFLIVTALGIVVVPVGLNLRGGPHQATGTTLISPSPSPAASDTGASPSPSISVSASP
jgi:hypothetical protein